MISAIFSIDQFGNMGNRKTLPWRYDHPMEVERFHKLTQNAIIVLSRKAWDDRRIAKLVKDSYCIVATNRPKTLGKCRTISGDLVHALKQIRKEYPNKNIFVIGGANMLTQCKDALDMLYVTHRKGTFFNDVRININEYFSGMRCLNAIPVEDRSIVFSTYKNIDPFRPE